VPLADLLHDPLVWVGAAAAFAASLVRGFSGFGAGMIFVPVAAACFGPRVAAGILLIVDSLLVLPFIPRALPRIDWRDLLPMAIGSVITVPLGAWVLLAVDPVPIRWAISVVILGFVVLLAGGWRYRGPIRASLSLAVGAVAGFMGGVAQISGPPVLIYWLGREIVSATMRANAIVFFCFSAIATGVAFLLAGILTREVMLLALLYLPVYALGLVLGSRLFGRASEATYRAIAYAVIVFVAVTTLPVFG
jgi:uncharacterized membrane protein YfcA